jgi:2-polyprenyl-6-methoxyphenol hydroxylase-like FAD-dependent oxidoreductase
MNRGDDEESVFGSSNPRAADSSRAQHAGCLIVGGGPAGALLGLMLARRGVDVTVLEKHADLDRSFRGNTLNPAALRILDRVGLAEAALALPHTKTTHFTAVDAAGPVRFADFGALDDRFPFVALIQQADFLPLLFDAAGHEPSFCLITGAAIVGLIEEGGVVRGVEVERDGERETWRAALVVGCDGRGSAVRRLAGLEPEPVGAPIDVLWFTLPRRPSDDASAGAVFRFGPGLMLALMDAGTHWQVGAIIRKGSFPDLRSRGIEAFRSLVATSALELADRVGEIASWEDVALLRVQVDRLRRWYRPGVLLLGDAAHAMSPVGMVGINLALQDAEAAADLLAAPLLTGQVTEADLSAVQRRRERSVRLLQKAQALAHRFVLGPALAGKPQIPQPIRALMGWRPAVMVATRLIAYGGRS